ncbi:MAG: hypothetical protein IPJ77_18675 [Planctomycetes bacterium]|nr:hypothetical protein [Planctomycetota bacterium]
MHSDAPHPQPPARATPEELLARAGWFRALARALAGEEGLRRATPSAPGARAADETATSFPPSHRQPGSRGGARADAEVLHELRFQSALLAEIEALAPHDRDALLDAFFRTDEPPLASPRLDSALASLRAALDRGRGGRERWLAELPAWALTSAPAAVGAKRKGELRLDRWSRGLLVLAVALVLGFGGWSLFARSSAAEARSEFAVPWVPIRPVDASRSVIEGAVHLPGVDVTGWRCWIALPGADTPPIAQTFVRADGTFQLDTSATGEFELQLQDLPNRGVSHRLVRTVHLNGQREKLAFQAASYLARGGDASLAGMDLLHTWSDGSGWTLTTRLHLDTQGHFTNQTLPVGPATLSVLPSNEALPDTLQELSDLPAAAIELEHHY